MNTFNVADFVAKDGIVILAGSYVERVEGCGVTVSVLGTSPFPSEKECFQYTFWLFRLPNSNGSYDSMLSCFKKEKVVAIKRHTICPYCGVHKISVLSIS